jgi:DNA-binding NarL/FixJ family response regulator
MIFIVCTGCIAMLTKLTDREIEIIRLIAHGLTNKQIASMLILSLSTVENHIHHIYVKLGIFNRAQAVARAFQAKIIPGEIISEDEGNPP